MLVYQRVIFEKFWGWGLVNPGGPWRNQGTSGVYPSFVILFVHRIPCEVGSSWDLKEPILRLTSQVPDIFDLKTKGARVVDLDEGMCRCIQIRGHVDHNNGRTIGDHDHREPPFPLQKSNSRCHPVPHCAIGLLGHIPGSVQAERSWCPSFASAANDAGQRVTEKGADGADARVERGPSRKIATGCNMTTRHGLMGYGLAHRSPFPEGNMT